MTATMVFGVLFIQRMRTNAKLAQDSKRSIVVAPDSRANQTDEKGSLVGARAIQTGVAVSVAAGRSCFLSGSMHYQAVPESRLSGSS
jgi:hypothetical protein